MKRSFDVLIAMLAVAGLVAIGSLSVRAEGPNWSYAGATGPAKWGKLDKSYAECAQGKMQSPIDIPDAQTRKGDLPPILFDYKPSPLRIIDNGHTIQVNYAPDSWISVNGTRYQLVQIDFHKPSEEKVSGKGHEMVAHLTHKDKDGKLAVIAVFLDPGAENPLIKTLWSNLPAMKDKETVAEGVTINAYGLLPKSKNYYTFAGSLTTPPCSEPVTWYVLQAPMQVSADEIARFARIYPNNARPLQPVNDRDIEGSAR